MTVLSTVRTAGPFPGTGSTGPFAFAFKIFDATDLVVQITNGGVNNVLTSGFSVSLNDDQSTDPGGTVTLSYPLAVGSILNLGSKVPNTQETQLTPGGAYYPKTIEDALDRSTIQIQQMAEQFSRALLVPLGASGTTLPSATQLAGRMLAFDDITAASTVTPFTVSQVANAVAAAYAAGSTADAVTFLAAGTGMVARSLQEKGRDLRGPKDAGATGLAADDATSAVQAVINAALDDNIPGNSVIVPDGDFRVSTLTVDLTRETTSSAGRFSLFGFGNASQLTMRDSPNGDILSINANAGQSFGSDIRNMRFGVATQGNNVDASVLNTGTTSTMLDFQVLGNYVNGMPRGFSGQFVSGIFASNIFDFMTDYAIWGRSKEFRKVEIVGNHFYKVKQRPIHIQGEIDSSGGATLLADRDNGRGAGHMCIVANGFDRIFDASETSQNIYLNYVDNVLIEGNWHNGKTPDSTDYPLDAVRVVTGRQLVIGPETAWMFSRGVYIEDFDYVKITGLSIYKGNLAGNFTTIGAVTLKNVRKVDLDVMISEPGGIGLMLDTCTEVSGRVQVYNAQGPGVVVKDCTRGALALTVVDANQANAGYVGVDVTGTTSGIDFAGTRSYVTDTSQGQVTNLRFGASTSLNYMASGNLTGVRTGGAALSDLGANNKFGSNIRGWTLRNGGTVTLTNPATTVTVLHGLAVTPTPQQIRIIQINVDAAGVTRDRVQNCNATTFDIVVNAAPTTSAQFGWEANAASYF